jgi:hypothetical protein
MRHRDQCRKGYHDYTRKETHGNIVISKCEICDKVIRENLNNTKEFSNNHKRDFLQRTDKDFKWIYPEKPFEKKPDENWENPDFD